jgi:hypothetical protein
MWTQLRCVVGCVMLALACFVRDCRAFSHLIPTFGNRALLTPYRITAAAPLRHRRLVRQAAAHVHMDLGSSSEILRTGGNLGQFILRPSCTFSTVQGHRQYMEDVVFSSMPLGDISRASFFAVFDGHLGKKAALHAKDRLAKILAEELASISNPREALRRAFLKYASHSGDPLIARNESLQHIPSRSPLILSRLSPRLKRSAQD